MEDADESMRKKMEDILREWKETQRRKTSEEKWWNKWGEKCKIRILRMIGRYKKRWKKKVVNKTKLLQKRKRRGNTDRFEWMNEKKEERKKLEVEMNETVNERKWKI